MHAIEIKDFLANLTLVLGVAALISFIFHKLRQPVVLGYILAGMIIGPYVPIPLAADSAIVHTLSELGIILLMFSLGLEFSIRKFFKVLPTVGLIALIQCGFMIWLGDVAGRAFGWTAIESFYAGAIIAISSTTIIVKAFSEIGIRDKVTEVVFGVLIVEDLIAILLLAGLPIFTQQTDAAAGASGWVLAKAAGTLVMFLVTLLVGGILLVPKIVRVVMRMNRPEMTLVVSIGICFGISLLAKEMGYSVALGAFIAGSLMAEAGEEGYLDTLIRPIRDMFAAIFFVSVGMLIDPTAIGNQWLAILVFTLLVVIGKFLGVAVGAFLAGYGTRLSIRSGMSLAQIGEFSFIIAGVGITTGATRDFLYPLAVAVSAITTLTTPWLIRISDPVANWVDHHLPERLQTFANLYRTWIYRLRQPHPDAQKSRITRLFLLLLVDTVFLVGLIVAASLSIDTLMIRVKMWIDLPESWTQVIGIGVVALLAVPFLIGIIRCIRALGVELTARVLPQKESGKLDLAAAPRRVFTVTLQLAIVLLIGMPLLALTQPFVGSYYAAIILAAIITVLASVFWRSTTQLHGHVQAGAQMVIEMLNTSLKNSAENSADKHKEIAVSQLEQFLPGLGSVFSIRLTAESPAIGKSLANLHFRTVTGAHVIAITQGTEGAVVPTGHEKLQEGAILVISGTEEALQLARELLLGK